MTIHGPEGVTGPEKIQHINDAAKKALSQEKAPVERRDDVEISDIARYRQALEKVPEIRVDRVREIREAIERGDYETPEKLEIAIERLLKDLEG